MKQKCSILVLAAVLLFTTTTGAQAKSSAQLVFEDSLFGAAVGAVAALGIGLIGNNLSTAPWLPATGLGIFGGLVLGVLEVQNNPSRYSNINSDGTLVATMPPAISSLSLLN